MGFLEKLRGKATEAVDKHGAHIGEGIDEAAEIADRKTGGKHAARIDTGAEKAKDALDKIDGKDDDIK